MLITCWLPETEFETNSDATRCAPGTARATYRAGGGSTDHLDPPVVGLVGMVSFNIIHFDWEYDAPV